MPIISTRGVKDRVLRWKLITRWAWNRYATNNGASVLVSIARKPTRYALIEDAASAKLLGARRQYAPGTVPAGA